MTTTWTKVDDGEYNEQTTVVNGVTLTLYSDRDGGRWACRLGEAEPHDLESTAEYAARREALAIAKES